MGEEELARKVDPERAREFRRRYAALCNEFGLVVDSYEETWITVLGEWERELVGEMPVYGDTDDGYHRGVVVPSGPDPKPLKQS